MEAGSEIGDLLLREMIFEVVGWVTNRKAELFLNGAEHSGL